MNKSQTPDDIQPVATTQVQRPARLEAPNLRRRLARAAMLGSIGTVVLALLATQLATHPRRPAGAPASEATPSGPLAGASAGRSGTQTSEAPSEAPTAAPSPLPKLMRTLPGAPTGRLLVEGNGRRLLELETGALSKSLDPPDGWQDRIVELADGAGYLVATVSRKKAGSLEEVQVRLRRLNARGSAVSERDVAAYRGIIDPNGPTNDQSNSVDLALTFSPDDEILFVGSAARAPGSWNLALTLIDVGSGRTLQRLSLGSEPSDAAPVASPSNQERQPCCTGPGRHAWPPTVVVAPDGRHLLIRSTVVVGNEVASTTYWKGRLRANMVEGITRLPSSQGSLADAQCRPNAASFATDEELFVVCTGPGPNLDEVLVRRTTLDGTRLDEVDVSEALGSPSGPNALTDHANARLYLWNPFAWTIARIDLRTGQLDARKTIHRAQLGVAAADNGGFLGGLARALAGWLAPSATAKVYFQPALAISADGSRLFVLTTNAKNFTDGGAGSAGILVLDAQTLDVIDRWAPLADLVSIAVSNDGRFVYALGSAGGNESGDRWEASLTAYDSTSGVVREIVGDLGQDWLMFPDPTQR